MPVSPDSTCADQLTQDSRRGAKSAYPQYEMNRFGRAHGGYLRSLS